MIRVKVRWLPIIIGCVIVLEAGFTWLALFGPRTNVVELVPTLTGQKERCLTCHQGIETMGAAHPTDKFGCVSCHGGQAMALDATTAHQDIIRNPGDLSVANQICGKCHAAQAALVPRSLMSTYAGAIALVRHAFGLQPDGTAHFATAPIGDLQTFTTTASDPLPVQHFNRDCQTCHLRAEPIQAPGFYRSTGCSACHVLYNNDGLYKGSDPTIPKNQLGQMALHNITKQIPYTQCNHCHNQGNYDLRTMTFLPRNDLPAPANLSGEALHAYSYYQPIGKFTRCEFELDCIDCHTKTEIMGDGILHNNRSEVQTIQCQTCHGTRDAYPAQMSMLDVAPTPTPISPNASLGSAVLMTAKGEPLTNIQFVNGQWILTGKVSGISYVVPMVKDSKCQQRLDQQGSQYCHECHSYDRGATPTAAP